MTINKRLDLFITISYSLRIGCQCVLTRLREFMDSPALELISLLLEYITTVLNLKWYGSWRSLPLPACCYFFSSEFHKGPY